MDCYGGSYTDEGNLIQMNATIILSMAGGLGLFLYGMRIMSDSIEKVAGAKLRGIL